MSEQGGAAELPLFAWSAAKAASQARRRRRATIVLVAAGIAALGAPAMLDPAPRWLWNASASAPLGLYRVTPGAAPRRSDWVIAWPPPSGRALADERHYLPAHVPLVKKVAAVVGDRACASGATITIAGRRVATRRARDARGRPLPWTWRGCRTLGAGEFLLLNPAPASFDGRYFGVTRRREIIGTARPAWVE